MEEIIQGYIDGGFLMIPLRTDLIGKKGNGKIPLYENWPYRGSCDTEEVTGWIEQGHNIGILTGLPSGVIVLDVDGEEGKSTLSELGHDIDTFTVATGNGIHYYFHTNKSYKNRVRIREGLDIRADGGQVVAPPSIHPETGKAYRIINDSEPAEIPEWLDAILSQENTGISGKTAYFTPGTPPAGEPIPEGQRNNTLFLIGCSMRGAGASARDIYAHLSGVNSSLCSPPLDEKEIRTIANQASNYQEGKRPGDYTSIYSGADEVDISIPGRIYEYFRKSGKRKCFFDSTVLYTALRQISLLNGGEPIYNYAEYIHENYMIPLVNVPRQIREFEKLGILSISERNSKGEFKYREIEFHPSKFNGGQNDKKSDC